MYNVTRTPFKIISGKSVDHLATISKDFEENQSGEASNIDVKEPKNRRTSLPALALSVNAVRGFFNDFKVSRETEKTKRKQEKKQKLDEHTHFNGELATICFWFGFWSHCL